MSYGLVLILAPFAIGLPILGWRARRFAARRRAEGAWDASGPLHPTEPPADFLKPRGIGSGIPPEDLFAKRPRGRRDP